MKHRLLLYISTCLLLALAPGPDNCFVLAQSVAYGTSAGIWITLGLMTGLCVHITLAIFGTSTFLTRFPQFSNWLLTLGACYLLYMAFGLFFSEATLAVETEAGTALTFYTRGIILNLSNPKIILFFVAFLPKFLPTPCPHKTLELLRLGGLFILSAFSVMGGIACLGGIATTFLRDNPSAMQWISRGAAIAIAGIAIHILYPILRGFFPGANRTPTPES